MACCIKSSFIRESTKLRGSEQSLQCNYCQTCVDRLQYSNELNEGYTDGHCIVYFSVSSSEVSVMVGASANAAAAPSANATGSLTVKPGSPLVKMFKPIPSADEHDLINDPSSGYANYFPTSPDGDYVPYCTWCFEYCHNKRFCSAATSLKGFAYIIISDYELNPISVGTS